MEGRETATEEENEGNQEEKLFGGWVVIIFLQIYTFVSR